MVSALLAIVAFLAVGHAVLGALLWALLSVPESNVVMIALSALLAVLIVIGVAWVETLAWLSWTATDGRVERARRSVRAVPAFLAALTLFAVVYWLTGRAADWLVAHRGEIDAWLIVHVRIVKSRPLHAALGWLVWFARYPLGLSLALGLLAHLAPGSAASRPSSQSPGRPSRNRTSVLSAAWSWLRTSLHPLRLALITLSVLGLIWLPWQAVDWRPKALPPTWLEPAFGAVKWLVLYLLANLGWGLVLRTSRQRQ